MTRPCPGIVKSEITGEPYCPRDIGICPPEWGTWEDFCQTCRENQERWIELQGDAKREEGGEEI